MRRLDVGGDPVVMLAAALQEAAERGRHRADHRGRHHLHRRLIRRITTPTRHATRIIDAQRPLGRTGMSVSAVSFGAWAIGSSWGPVDDTESMAALHAAIDAGVNFIDTADVYGDGKSERLVAQAQEGTARRRDLGRDQGRAAPAGADARGLHARESDRVGRAQPAESRRPRRSTCCSCTARIRPSTIGRRCSASSTTSSPRARSATTGSASRPSPRHRRRFATRASKPCRSSSTCSG